MPCNYKDYPDNWRWLSKQIIHDAGNKCELCYAPNGKIVYRPKGEFLKLAWRPWYIFIDDGTDTKNLKENLRKTKIVLTVHHIDGNKKNSRVKNLIALCQRCHLRLDLDKHMMNRMRGKPMEADV